MGKPEEKNANYLAPICCANSDANVIESKHDPHKLVKSAQRQRRRWIFNKREKRRDKRDIVMVDRGEQYDERDIQPPDIIETSATPMSSHLYHDGDDDHHEETDKTELLPR